METTLSTNDGLLVFHCFYQLNGSSPSHTFDMFGALKRVHRTLCLCSSDSLVGTLHPSLVGFGSSKTHPFFSFSRDRFLLQQFFCLAPSKSNCSRSALQLDRVFLLFCLKLSERNFIFWTFPKTLTAILARFLSILTGELLVFRLKFGEGLLLKLAAPLRLCVLRFLGLRMGSFDVTRSRVST